MLELRRAPHRLGQRRVLWCGRRGRVAVAGLGIIFAEETLRLQDVRPPGMDHGQRRQALPNEGSADWSCSSSSCSTDDGISARFPGTGPDDQQDEDSPERPAVRGAPRSRSRSGGEAPRHSIRPSGPCFLWGPCARVPLSCGGVGWRMLPERSRSRDEPRNTQQGNSEAGQRHPRARVGGLPGGRTPSTAALLEALLEAAQQLRSRADALRRENRRLRDELEMQRLLDACEALGREHRRLRQELGPSFGGAA